VKHTFKRGIEISISPKTTFADWTNAKMCMDLIIGTEGRGEGVEFFPDGRKNRKGKVK
jgi:hypothetical protein